MVSCVLCYQYERKHYSHGNRGPTGAKTSLSEPSDQRIKFGIIESTFTDFKTITNDYFKYHIGFNSKPLTYYLVYRAGKIAEFNVEDAKPIQYCKTIEQPIILIHGTKDKRINIKYAKENFEKIPSIKKEFLELKNANHLNVWKVGGENYFQNIMSFIEKNR